jgi:hypothetical protein
MAGLILIDSMILNFTPDSKKISSLQFTWDCYGRMKTLLHIMILSFTPLIQ